MRFSLSLAFFVTTTAQLMKLLFNVQLDSRITLMAEQTLVVAGLVDKVVVAVDTFFLLVVAVGKGHW
jgi:hypothetical protein